MKKILQITTYPIKKAQHGGQKRVVALKQQYESIGIKTSNLAIFTTSHYKDFDSSDIILNKKHENMINSNPFIGDLITGRLLRDDAKIKDKVIGAIIKFKPDIIQIEHPFLYIGLEGIINDISYNGKLIYSSHNIEYSMKREMLESEGYGQSYINDAVSEILNIEKKLLSDADLIISVSESDVHQQIKLGADKDKIVLARNGINPPQHSKENKKKWSIYFEAMGVDSVAVFVGSAHPPNWHGYIKMISHKIGRLKSNERIILAGGIGDYLKSIYDINTFEGATVWKRVHSVGVLGEEDLNGLLDFAKCIILPIVEGGGSNLKTAEALLYCKRIVGTTYAFRSFESYSNHDTIKITDSPYEFRTAILDALRAELPVVEKSRRKMVQEVRWEACLRSALERVDNL